MCLCTYTSHMYITMMRRLGDRIKQLPVRKQVKVPNKNLKHKMIIYALKTLTNAWSSIKC